ncbi:MAG: DUF4013 domain-containing protein [Bacteroidota bacterium]
MDLGKAFTYQFEDRRWLNKLGLAALIAAVPVLNFAFSGYIVEVLRNVARKSPEPLPEWDDLGAKLSEGFILFAAAFIYTLPGLIVLCLPLSLIAASGLFSGNENLRSLANSIGTAGSVLFFCLLCLFLLYVLLLSIIHPAITVMFAREGKFASCFKIGAILEMIRRDPANFFTAWIGYVAATLGVGLVVAFVGGLTGWIPCIGWAVGVVLSLGSVVYIATVYGHLFGQFAQPGSGQD